MNTVQSLSKSLLAAFWVGASLHSTFAHANNAPAQTPLFVSQSVAPLNMLVMGRDHKLYYEAYNDASDLDGDGVLDVGYKPEIDYYGYFNSNVCYDYTGDKGTANKQAAANGRFIPKSKATGDNSKQCNGLWSGDFLNYLTTSRMDAMRRVLYGGQRTEDTTTRTVLEAAYIPRDGHAWGKSYDPQRDTYDISHYAPSLDSPDNKKRHLFAITSMGVEESNRTQLRVLKNTDWQVWDWVSRESTNGQGGQKCGSANQKASNGKTGAHDCGTTIGYNVRVEACTGVAENLREENCKAYPNQNSQPIYKPTGLLHDFGESEDMHFGLLTGSYQKNISGGTLRRNISKFTEEVNPQTGVFTDANGIVANINRLKVIDFNSSNYYTGCNWDSKYKANPIDYSGGNSADCAMWGNPVAEMMFETLRYFAGAEKAHTEYDYGSDTSKDKTHNLAKPAWTSPYTAKSSGGGGYPHCARPVMTVLSDINPSYDYKLPGSRYQSIAADAAALSDFNVSTEVDAIGSSEGIHGNDYFIGQSASGNSDDAPTPKSINALSWARGLAPEEPSKRGTYYSAGVARYGAMNKIAGTSAGKSEVLTYAVALASPLPQIRIPVSNGHVTVVPFAKSVKSSTNPAIDINKFVPTNPIVDYYVDSIANTGDTDRDTSINAGRPYAKFIINYEDMEVGSDHDMDAIAEYTVALQANGQVKVDVVTTFKAGSTVQHMGYVISGTTKDGIYIEIQDSNKNNVFYPLNTPKDKDPGWCQGKSNDSLCKNLPLSASRTFDYSSSSSAGEFLKDPLWYAAKYGIPNRNPAEVAGDPDNYFLVTNALTLKDQLTSAFNDIMQRNNSVTSPAIKPTTTQTADSEFFVYRTDYNVETWSGDLIKETIDTNTGDRTPHWNAASGSVAGRSIKMVNGESLANFTWNNLTEDQQNALNTNPETNLEDNAGAQRLAFIKGENDSFRKRSNRLLGDIINSSPVVVEGAQYLHYLAEAIEPGSDYASFASDISNRKSLVFIGANDGMLHAFNTETGAEEFAFVPSAVIPSLNKLTSSGYNEAGGEHHFFVDGTPVVRDVYINSQWRTVLVGTLRAGGRSIFALDITDPDSISLLWELNVGDDLSDAEKTAGTASDVGYSFPVPTIARLHNGNWAVVTGNGYDSASGRAVLFLIDIADGNLTKIPTKASDVLNGLSSVRVADNNSDGIADYVYAGDLKGNLWRFDLDPTGKAGSSGYQVSFGGSPLYTAKDKADNTANTQAITAPPSLVRHPNMTGYIVIFGTGRYFQIKDKETDRLDTLYGIWDTQTKLNKVASETFSLSEKNLLEQSFYKQTTNTWNANNPEMPTVSKSIRLLTEEPINWGDSENFSQDKHYGWRLDLKVGNTTDGERIVDEMAARGQVLLFTTRTPSNDPCEAGLTGWTYGINPYTGGRTSFNVFDFNRSTTVSDGDSFNGTVISGFETPAGGISLSGDTLFSTDGSSITVDFGASVSGRQSWQIIPEDE
ncbi:pilus assembly protein [Pseudomonas saudiphocaensis]|uniref:pilus assembly protein n=1 Tax=Pseudomonas saudiphocaensis TaxID=1499686 RepID=UPI000F77197E|nr:PilC/PilY family type IV pilus protein [Pseudomonas saudiphocaensis]RRV12657.1 hypothetical protein EGJ00_15995 [Pseudomonas saudiphocaensis]